MILQQSAEHRGSSRRRCSRASVLIRQLSRQVVTVEHPQHGVGVADVDREQHGWSVSGQGEVDGDVVDEARRCRLSPRRATGPARARAPGRGRSRAVRRSRPRCRGGPRGPRGPRRPPPRPCRDPRRDPRRRHRCAGRGRRRWRSRRSASDRNTLRDGQRQAVGLADGRHPDHLDAEVEVGRHPADQHQLLVVLLAEVGAVGADGAEQLGDDGQHAAEVPGPRRRPRARRPAGRGRPGPAAEPSG